jgi:hypothetical protein
MIAHHHFLELGVVVLFVRSAFCFSGPDNNGEYLFCQSQASCCESVHKCIQTLTRTDLLSIDTCAYLLRVHHFVWASRAETKINLKTQVAM